MQNPLSAIGHGLADVGKGVAKGAEWEAKNQLHALESLDTMVANEFGSPRYYTISAETAKHWELRPLKELLDAIQAKHAEGALVHDKAVQSASDAVEAQEKAEGLP